MDVPTLNVRSKTQMMELGNISNEYSFNIQKTEETSANQEKRQETPIKKQLKCMDGQFTEEKYISRLMLIKRMIINLTNKQRREKEGFLLALIHQIGSYVR